MKRILLTTALCATLPVTAWADDILIRADLSQATVYGAGADVSRTGTAALPTGRHRLLIAMPDIFAAQLPQIVGPEAVRFGPPQVIQNHPVAEGALDTPAQATARAAVETAEQGVLDAQDALAHADASIRAIEAQQGYIAAILRGGENGVAMPQDPTLVPQFLATLGEQTARLADELLTAQMARRDLVEAVDDAQRAFAEAAQALQALAPFGLNIGVIAVDVTVPEAIEADITLDYFTYEAGWRPSYELNLETDPGALEVERFVLLQTSGAARWEDVAVTFSTSDPNRTREPSELSSTPARLIEPVPESRIAGEVLGTVAPAPQTAIGRYGAGFADAVAPVVAVEAPVEADFNGLSVSYRYPAPVSVGPTGQILLPFDSLDLEVELENRAVPRWDDTAFLVAMAENDSGEPILPGEARFYRDGALIGEGYLPLIPAGADAEIAFGALDHLRLVWIDRSLAEGDRGLFVSSSTQSREIAFGVENIGTEAESVRIVYATPYAEQEDLDLDLTLSRQPSERDVDDLRGVHGWDLVIAPGETELVEMVVDFEFPESRILDWRP